MYTATDHEFATAAADHMTMPDGLSGYFDLSNYDAVQEIAICFDTPRNAYDRAIQALRDVRHMLPQRGVAIVDAVLDGTV